MTTPWPRLRDLPLAVQFAAMVGSIAFISATLGVALAGPAVAGALAGAPAPLVVRATSVATLVALVTGACAVVASLGAAAFLRASIGGLLGCMEAATDAIAAGGFEHRIASARRDELGRLASSIDRMAERLSQAEQGRHRLLASVSHELRTPLTVIRGHAFTLARSEQDDSRAGRLRLIDGEVERLASMVEDLLAAAMLRVSPATLRLDPLSVDELVEEAVRRFQPTAAERGVRLRRSTPAPALHVMGDEARLQQVLGNLLANAVNHAPEGSVVDVAAATKGAPEGRVTLTVVNGGPGIPVDMQDAVLEPFVQGPHSTGSVGLGLCIARDLVDAHGGALTLRSCEGRTEVEFDLETCAAPAAAAHEHRRLAELRGTGSACAT